MKQSIERNHHRELRVPYRERMWMLVSLIITAVVVIYGLWTMFHIPSAEWHTRGFKGILKNYGSQARILLFAVLASYLFLFVLKKSGFLSSVLKRGIVTLLRIARKVHAPLAILAIGVILLHIIGAFLYGITFDFANISGLLAGAILLPVPIAGWLRYSRLDRNWHVRLGLAFAVLFLIHAFL